MYRPGRGFDLFTPLVQMGALLAWLWERPTTPPSPRARVALRVAAVAIASLAIPAGVLFSYATFSETEPWARFVTGCLTFGLFGLPTSVIAIVIGAILVHAHAGQGVSESVAAILLAVTFFAQWLLLAGGLLRRSSI
jgi:hypothetical protein